jgi:hypothetical protein
MPRQSKKSPNYQREINPQSTFRYTTPNLDVPYRPTSDAGLTQFPERTGEVLLEALDSFSGAASTFNRTKKLQDKKYAKQGKEDALAGKGLSPDAPEAQIDAYYEIKGQAALYDMNQEILQWTTKNPNAAPDEWMQFRSSVLNKYSQDAPHDGYLRGLLPGARQLLSGYDEKVWSHQKTIVQQENLNNFSKSFRMVAEDEILHGNPDNISTNLRKHLTEYQKRYNNTLDRKQTSLTAIRAIGPIAERLGKPELLDFVYTKDSEGGVAIADNPDLQKEIRTWRNRAQANAQNGKLNALDTFIKENHVNSVTGGFKINDAIASLNNPEFRKANGISYDDAQTLIEDYKGQWKYNVKLQNDARKKRTTSAIDEAYAVYVEEQNPDKAIEMVRNNPYIEAEKKFDIIKEMRGEKEDGEEPNVMNDVIAGIRNGTLKTKEDIDEYVGKGGITITERNRAVKFLKSRKSDQYDMMEKALEQVEESMKHANMMSVELPENVENINKALLKTQDELQKVIDENGDIRPLIDPESNQYILGDIINAHRMSLSEYLVAMEKQLSGGGSNNDNEDVIDEQPKTEVNPFKSKPSFEEFMMHNLNQYTADPEKTWKHIQNNPSQLKAHKNNYERFIGRHY